MMMKIGFSALEHHAEWALIVDFLAKSKLQDVERRSTRTATLDGGAVLTDYGYSDADRVITATFRPDMAEDVARILRDMLQGTTRIIVSLPDGAYLAHLKRMTDTALTIEIIGAAELNA